MKTRNVTGFRIVALVQTFVSNWLNGRRAKLLEKLQKYIDDGAIEFSVGDYRRGRCKGEPLALWSVKDGQLVSNPCDPASAKSYPVKFHISPWWNCALLVEGPRMLSGGAWIIRAAGKGRCIWIS
jgi:hypothetical protein